MTSARCGLDSEPTAPTRGTSTSRSTTMEPPGVSSSVRSMPSAPRRTPSWRSPCSRCHSSTCSPARPPLPTNPRIRRRRRRATTTTTSTTTTSTTTTSTTTTTTVPDEAVDGTAVDTAVDAAVDADEFEIPEGAAITTLELEILAPTRCGNGESSRRRPPRSVSLSTQVDPALIVATGARDCASRPTSFRLGATTSGPVVAVDVSATVPGGPTLARSLNGGPNRWQATIGSIPGSASMPASSSFDLVVRAVDARGGIHTDTVRVTLARPEPCAGDTTDTTPESTVAPDATTLAVSTSPSPLVLWATATGRCPAGPTTAQVSVSVPDGVTAVGMEVRVGSAITRSTLTEAGARRWTGTIGPFTATSSMPASGTIEVRVTATAGGQERTASATGTVRRPDACGSATTQPSGAATTTAPRPPPRRPPPRRPRPRRPPPPRRPSRRPRRRRCRHHRP